MTGLVVQLQRDTSVGCSDWNLRSFTVNQGFSGSHSITGLEPGNGYTITVTVFNAAGSAPVSNAVTATTLQTSKRLSQYCIHIPVIYCCSTQNLQEVPPQSDVVQSLLVV